MTSLQTVPGKDARTTTRTRVDRLAAEGTPRQAPTSRPCDWCDETFQARTDSHRTCSDDCRFMLSKWRRGIGPFAPGATGQDQHGRTAPANPVVAREHRDRDRMRARRATGQVPSDQRIQITTAVDACVAAIRMVARVPVEDARVIALEQINHATRAGRA